MFKVLAAALVAAAFASGAAFAHDDKAKSSPPEDKRAKKGADPAKERKHDEHKKGHGHGAKH